MKNDVKAKLFRGFADPSRSTILEVLRGGRRCVSELVEATRLSQPNLSMHLACLRDCGLVRARRDGRFVYYELADASVEDLLEAADQVLSRVAKLIAACPRYKAPTNQYDRAKSRNKPLRLRSA